MFPALRINNRFSAAQQRWLIGARSDFWALCRRSMEQQ
jgi:hypothetical protein